MLANDLNKAFVVLNRWRWYTMNQHIFEQAIQLNIPRTKTVLWKEWEKYHLSIRDITNKDKKQKPLLITPAVTKHFWEASYSDKKYNQCVSLEFKYLKDPIYHSAVCYRSFSSNSLFTENASWMNHNRILWLYYYKLPYLQLWHRISSLQQVKMKLNSPVFKLRIHKLVIIVGTIVSLTGKQPTKPWGGLELITSP